MPYSHMPFIGMDSNQRSSVPEAEVISLRELNYYLTFHRGFGEQIQFCIGMS
jgi:hypothetical protein